MPAAVLCIDAGPRQAERAEAFRALHRRNHAFIIPNPWDVGTARLLAQLGFDALATTSAGFAFSQGQTDNTLSRAQMMTHLEMMATAIVRGENYLVGNPDLADTIKRLQAYQDAGADVLYAPGLSTGDEIAAVVSSVERPVSVVMGLKGASLSRDDPSALGVRRISVGSALSRTALAAFLRAAKEMRDHGAFTFAKDALSIEELSVPFRR